MSIIGGIFIRNKIISDNLYLKRFYIFQKQLKQLEHEIYEFEEDLKKHKNDNENLVKNIQHQKNRLVQLDEDIFKNKQEIERLNARDTSNQKAEKLNLLSIKSKRLKNYIKKTELSIKELENQIFEFNKVLIRPPNLIFNLYLTKQTLLKLKEILNKHYETISDYIDVRVGIEDKIDDYREHIDVNIELKNRLEENLKVSKSSLALLNDLIFKLEKKIIEKNLEISNLKTDFYSYN